LLALMTLVLGIWKLVHAHDHYDVIISAIGWDLLNLMILNACIGVLYERRQRRATPRVPANMPGHVFFQPQAEELDRFPCQVIDISPRGAQLSFDVALAPHLEQGIKFLRVFNRALDHDSELPIVVRNSFVSVDKKSLLIGIQFTDRSVTGLSETVALSSGDSLRWAQYRERRNQSIGIVRSVLLLIKLGTVHAGGQYVLFFKELSMYLKRKLLDPVLSTHVVQSFPYKIKKFYAHIVS